jgi:hypothetical protein
MRRTHHDPYATDRRGVRYIAVWTMQHEVIEYEIIPPCVDLRAAIEHLKHEGWEAESDAAWGSAFIYQPQWVCYDQLCGIRQSREVAINGMARTGTSAGLSPDSTGDR